MKSGKHKATAERVVKDIRRKTRRLHSAEEKIRIVLEGLRGEESIAELCRREGIAQSLYSRMEKCLPFCRYNCVLVSMAHVKLSGHLISRPSHSGHGVLLTRRVELILRQRGDGSGLEIGIIFSLPKLQSPY